jgi:hypothetical protein
MITNGRCLRHIDLSANGTANSVPDSHELQDEPKSQELHSQETSEECHFGSHGALYRAVEWLSHMETRRVGDPPRTIMAR